MIDGPGAHQRLGGPKELLHLDQVAIAQHRLQRGDPGVGAQDKEAVIARLFSNLADVDREGLLGGHAQVPAIGGVADQRLVTPLQLLVEGGNNGLTVGRILLGLGFVATDNVALALDLNLFDEELGLLTAGAWNAQGREWLLVCEHDGAHQAVGALAGTKHVFQPALLQGGDRLGTDHAAIRHYTDPTNGEAAAQAINDWDEYADI